MENKKHFNKKGLKKRLACIMMIYMDGVSGKKKENLNQYLEDKLSAVVDYYVSLLKKKERKNITIPDLSSEAVLDQLKSCEPKKIASERNM